MNKIIIPLIILIIICYGIYKKKNIYDDFLDGAKEGLKMIVDITPTIIAMIFAVNIFLKCGLLNKMVNIIINMLHIKIPFELISFALLRPISGTATLAILNNILVTYKPDSLISLIASTMQGCTDTTIYVLALYFASIKVSNSRYALVVGLFADLVGIIASIIIVYIIFR